MEYKDIVEMPAIGETVCFRSSHSTYTGKVVNQHWIDKKGRSCSVVAVDSVGNIPVPHTVLTVI